MIIRLTKANFSENNIGELNKFNVNISGSKYVSHTVTPTPPIDKGANATITVTAASGTVASDFTVTMKGNTITPSITETSTGVFTITVTNVTGTIGILVGEVVSVGTNLLDTIVYENLTYRDIFIDNNIAPQINYGSWDSTLGTYPTATGLTIEKANAETNCVPTYSIKVDGSTSRQSKGVADSKTHFAACNIKVSRYNKGNIGLFTDDETSVCVLNRATSGYETVVGKSTKSSRGFYVGSVNSADLTGYINNPVIIPTDIFSAVPTVEQFTQWYNAYNNILIENPDNIKLEEITQPTSLDSVIYENLTCRDIFINNNYAPDVNNNSYVSVKTGGTFEAYAGTSVPIVTETSTTNCVPTYSLKVEGTTSQQIYENVKGVPAGNYYFAYNINVTSYSKGYFGVMFDGRGTGNIAGSMEATAINKVTNGFESVAVKYKSSITDELYLGSISSASGNALINNPVVVPASIFKTAPTSSQFRTMFVYYNALLGAK